MPREYYLYTYSAVNFASARREYWNEVCELRPAAMMLNLIQQSDADENYHSFVLHNSVEITETEYDNLKTEL